jgi:hypothetical protein
LFFTKIVHQKLDVVKIQKYHGIQIRIIPNCPVWGTWFRLMSFFNLSNNPSQFSRSVKHESFRNHQKCNPFNPQSHLM